MCFPADGRTALPASVQNVSRCATSKIDGLEEMGHLESAKEGGGNGKEGGAERGKLRWRGGRREKGRNRS